MKTSEYLDCCELCTFHFYLVSFFFFQLNGSKIRGVQNISDARIEQWQIYGQPNTLWIFKKRFILNSCWSIIQLCIQKSKELNSKFNDPIYLVENQLHTFLPSVHTFLPSKMHRKSSWHAVSRRDKNSL